MHRAAGPAEKTSARWRRQYYPPRSKQAGENHSRIFSNLLFPSYYVPFPDQTLLSINDLSNNRRSILWQFTEEPLC